ncbi:uncharacterized protein LOC115407302 isoform X2 [Salarias fasciatus]|nr:uncharacterized protein LOC115407302 isoform X2 [Salarias fasciatus]
MTTKVAISSVLLEATPDYPVVAGQKVSLHCRAAPKPANVTWSWRRWGNDLHDQSSSELVLTEPGQSGEYSCHVSILGGQTRGSNTHTVIIISIQTTVGERLGIVAFILSIVTFIITLGILFWMFWKRFDQKDTSSSPAAKSFTGPGTTTKGGLPDMGIESDVYMNYTNSNPAYSDLDPNSMADDSVYSSLS